MKRTLMLAVSAVVLTAPTIAQDLPPGDPLPGECFARVIVPAQYETSTETIVTKQASEEIRKIPARFETVTERVLVQEPSFQIVPVGTPGSAGSPASTVVVPVNGVPHRITSFGAVIDPSGSAIGTVDGNGNIVGVGAGGGAGSVIAPNFFVPGTIIPRNAASVITIGSSSYRLDASGRAYRINAGDGSMTSMMRALNAGGGTAVGSISGNGSLVSSSGSMISSGGLALGAGTRGSSSSSAGSSVIPATYRTVTETVVVQEASTELVMVPAVYGTVTETVVVLSLIHI